jgi:integrase
MQNQPSQKRRKNAATGIQARHARSCASRVGRKCNCKPAYQAAVFIAREGKRLTRTFSSLAEAKAWRQDAYGAVRRGELRSPTRTTVSEAAEAWLERVKGGMILSRSGRPFKPSTVREYESDLRTYVLPAVGHRRLADVQRRDVQAIADKMLGEAWEPSTIRNAINPLRSIYRRAIKDGDVTINPTSDLELPAVQTRRERAATPAEASALLAALPDDLRPLYATAFFGGLRRGELRALRSDDIDLAASEIRVRRSWDDKAGEIAPKSEAGTNRIVPIPNVLRELLLAHGLQTKRTGSALVFGRSESEPFTPSHVRRKAEKAWADHNAELAEKMRPASEHLSPIGLHECRHSYVTLMYEAGNPLEKIGDYVGHSGTYMTDRYRHLLPGAGREAAAKLDAYLAEQIPQV